MAQFHHSGGIIPACAGSTRSTTARSPGIRDHPRMCGEHWQCPPKPAWSSGSSPHVRGAPIRRWFSRWTKGIIPACAGSTDASSRSTATSRDHPRMCGEHLDAEFMLASTSGSSPHVRGAQVFSGLGSPCKGIIPACAGSTSCGSGLPLGSRDHPRMCGEHKSPRMVRVAKAGSSPHVRGALVDEEPGFGLGGIIPACAGSTPA